MVFDLFLLSLSSSFPLLPFPVLELCSCGVPGLLPLFPSSTPAPPTKFFTHHVGRVKWDWNTANTIQHSGLHWWNLQFLSFGWSDLQTGYCWGDRMSLGGKASTCLYLFCHHCLARLSTVHLFSDEQRKEDKSCCPVSSSPQMFHRRTGQAETISLWCPLRQEHVRSLSR